MKRIALAAALSLGATAAFAGNLEPAPVEPAVEPIVIVEDTSSTAGGIVVPLLALILIAAAVASD
jgi:hypothetical protein